MTIFNFMKFIPRGHNLNCNLSDRMSIGANKLDIFFYDIFFSRSNNSATTVYCFTTTIEVALA